MGDPTPPIPDTDPAPLVDGSYDLSADPAGLLKLDLGGQKLAGKFSSVGEALTALEAAEKAMAVPETYDFGEHGTKFSPEELAEVGAFFKQGEVPAQVATKLLPKISEVLGALTRFRTLSDLGEYWDLPKSKLEERMGEVKAWFNSDRAAYVPQAVRDRWLSEGAWGYRQAYAEMTRDWERPVFNPEGEPPKDSGLTREERIAGVKK